MKNHLRTLSAGILLFSAGIISATEKSDAIALKDPYGVTLTITSVCVVFFALLILSIIYYFVGRAFTKGPKKETKKPVKAAPSAGAPDSETALAIAMALDRELSGETEAAIALALHRYLSETLHDDESYVITIRPTFGPYASRTLTLRQLPPRK